jgi:hypothetical protein
MPSAETVAADPKGRGCWYEVTAFVCVLCGHTDEYRERRWTPKPENPAERFHYIETACSGHFL